MSVNYSIDSCSLVREIITILASGDDAEDIEKGSKCCEKAAIIEKKNIMRTKNVIEKLASRRDEKKKSMMVCLQENQENHDLVVSLESKRKDAMGNMVSLNSQVGSVEETLKETEIAASNTKEAKASVEHATSEVLPKTKYTFSLYSNITRLRWDYESKEDELKGFVTSLRDVRPFTLNLKDNSKYFTANYLWDVIASC